jgi:hypothetical protein
VETPMAAMKILWSRSQHPRSSQFTFTGILARRRRRSASGSNSGDGEEGGETRAAANGNCSGSAWPN